MVVRRECNWTRFGGWFLVMSLLVAAVTGCGGADVTDQPAGSSPNSGGSTDSPASTATVTSTDPTATPKPTSTAAGTPTASGASATGDGAVGVVDAFRDVQEQVDFELAVPTDLQGLELVTDTPGSGAGPNPGISGSPASPTVNATFGAVRDGVPSMVSFIQSAGGLGDSSPEGEVETVTVHGVEARLAREERDSGEPVFNLRWQEDGMHYDLGGSGLEKEAFLALAESIRPLVEVG